MAGEHILYWTSFKLNYVSYFFFEHLLRLNLIIHSQDDHIGKEYKWNFVRNIDLKHRMVQIKMKWLPTKEDSKLEVQSPN